jgi:hypothetical protein
LPPVEGKEVCFNLTVDFNFDAVIVVAPHDFAPFLFILTLLQ